MAFKMMFKIGASIDFFFNAQNILYTYNIINV